MKRTCLIRKSLAAATGAFFLFLSLAGPYARAGAGNRIMDPQQYVSTTEPSGGEELPPMKEVVRLSWDNLSGPDSTVVGPASRVVLRVANLTRESVRADLTCTADNGGQLSEKRVLGSLSLAAFAVHALTVDLRGFGFKLTSLKYSGRLDATARLFLESDPDYRQIDSPALYFHPTSIANSLVFYGEETMLSQFNAGDFAERLSAADRFEPGAVTTRVMLGGAGVISSTPSIEEPAEEDEPGEEEHGGTSDHSLTGGQQQMGLGYNFTTCIKFLIRTVDSSKGIPNGPNAGGTEDYYQNANEGRDVIARGVRVKIWRGGWSQWFNADPVTGCFDWSHPSTTGFNMRVYGYSTDSAGNYVRIHDDPSDFADYPGDTYSALFTDLTLTPNAVNTYFAGNYDSKWTAMAVLAFGLYRYHNGLSGKEFHVGIDNTKSGGSSAHSPGQMNAEITSGRHYLRLGNGAGDGTPQTKYKFIVAHELGHAIAALYYGNHDDAVNGGEPSVILDHPVNDDNACGSQDEDGPSYSIDSEEWNSVGFREGFAHFVAAKIFNTKDGEGTFTWFAAAHDLERYNRGASNNAGGRLENQCLCDGSACPESKAGAGTVGDWLRFFWDWYTNSSNSCSDQPTKIDMLKLYRQVRLNGGLTKSNYFQKTREAADDLTNLADCLRTTRFDAYAAHNGIDN